MPLAVELVVTENMGFEDKSVFGNLSCPPDWQSPVQRRDVPVIKGIGSTSYEPLLLRHTSLQISSLERYNHSGNMGISRTSCSFGSQCQIYMYHGKPSCENHYLGHMLREVLKVFEDEKSEATYRAVASFQSAILFQSHRRQQLQDHLHT
jgi:hypothetical protein